MNRRQKKKAYKKKYGHNPPKTEVRYHGKEWGRIVSRAMDGIAEAISGLVPAIKKAIDSLANMAAEAIENIKTMPEEDFNRLLESSDLDEGTKEMARRIRRTGQNGLYNSNASETRRDSEGGYTAAGTGDNNELHGSRADNAAGNEQRHNNATGGSSFTNAAAPGVSNCERSYGSDD